LADSFTKETKVNFDFIFRVGKALLLGALMYFSLRALHFSKGASFAFSLVPAVLGSLNIMVGGVFALTGFVFIVACGLALLNDALASGLVSLKDMDIKIMIANTIKFIRSSLQ
jgi:hypothetical protein